MSHMTVSLDNASLWMAVKAALQGLPVGYSLFGYPAVHRILMAIYTDGLGVFLLIRILGSDTVGTLVVDTDDFFMGKFFLCKRRFDMALIGATDVLRNRIVRHLGNICMAVTTFDASMNAVIVEKFIDMIIPSLTVFIDPSHRSVLVAHQAVIFIGCLDPGANRKNDA